ncbi:N-succinyl-L-ornithine transcarbamylase [Flavobacterium arsenatis]|uniref:N-succinylornithine carbamoyltransferase n=1 Tax=Flavobacterium arsenatis TaxID=1484332 RepID=A0ABU1TS01_9FLAO|nr:acetylornithine carbamoyltransferase [Flavobacterium arsenatis]MDR6968630.1 N-succinyl-L-ornithine transcarbamylase [Flavobacterium arsenatis]
MKRFFSVDDVANLDELIQNAIEIKKAPLQKSELGKSKTLGLVFLNSSLRTRLSTQKAAQNLGLNTIVLNANQEAWIWEFEDNAIMNGGTVEHIKDAANVLSQYCDIIGIRCFAGLESKEEDTSEKIYSLFEKFATVPVISLESATLHPLQSLADCITIEEHKPKNRKPKVVLTWAPHIKSIPHAVGNSFAQWMNKTDCEFVITHPKGYELDTKFTQNATIENNQEIALQGADFVYIKNWSSFEKYGKTLPIEEDWLLTNKKLEVTNNAKIMHCLPVRRNVEVSDEVLDSEHSLIYKQANNRTFAAQVILEKILESDGNA